MTPRVAVTSFLLVFLLPFAAHGQTCKLQGGQYGFCQCEMSDGSGIVDLSPYANVNGEPEWVFLWSLICMTVTYFDLCVHHRFTVTDTSRGYEYFINLCFQLRQGGSCDLAAVSSLIHTCTELCLIAWLWQAKFNAIFVN